MTTFREHFANMANRYYSEGNPDMYFFFNDVAKGEEVLDKLLQGIAKPGNYIIKAFVDNISRPCTLDHWNRELDRDISFYCDMPPIVRNSKRTKWEKVFSRRGYAFFTRAHQGTFIDLQLDGVVDVRADKQWGGCSP